MAAALSTVVVGYAFYRRNPWNPAKRSNLLSSMVLASTFFWSILGTGLLFCTVMLEDYHDNPAGVLREVFGGSILTSLVVSGLMTVVARRFAIPRSMSDITAGPMTYAQLNSAFGRLLDKMGMRAGLVTAKVGNAFSVSSRGENLVAVSPHIVESLSLDEIEAVLAHELSHLRNNDSLVKGLARIARLAFPFDPVLRLLEAAVHRERELLADLSSVRFSGKPIALASALLKVHSGTASNGNGLGTASFVGSGKGGLLSLYPDLEYRVERLLDLARSMKTDAQIAIPA